MTYIWPKMSWPAVAVIPVWCSLFAGFAVLGRQCRGWFELGYWSTIDLHDLLNGWVGRPMSAHQLEAGLLEVIKNSDMSDIVGKIFTKLDPVIRWLLNDVPLALWLIAVIPTILLLSTNVRPFSLAERCPVPKQSIQMASHSSPERMQLQSAGTCSSRLEARKDQRTSRL